MSTKPSRAATNRAMPSSQPWLHQRGEEIQAFGTVRQFPVALSQETRLYSCQRLNQLLADFADSVRPVQETPLAGAGGDLLPAAPAAR